MKTIKQYKEELILKLEILSKYDEEALACNFTINELETNTITEYSYQLDYMVTFVKGAGKGFCFDTYVSNIKEDTIEKLEIKLKQYITYKIEELKNFTGSPYWCEKETNKKKEAIKINIETLQALSSKNAKKVIYSKTNY